MQALILAGPTMASIEYQSLSDHAVGSAIQIQRSSADVATLLRKSSVVVTMAGYNSICEALLLRKSPLVVPRRGPSGEQRIRSDVFARRKLIHKLAPEALTPENMAEELLRLMDQREIPAPENIPPMDGAQRAAALLMN